jgi:hypothetical protein
MRNFHRCESHAELALHLSLLLGTFINFEPVEFVGLCFLVKKQEEFVVLTELPQLHPVVIINIFLLQLLLFFFFGACGRSYLQPVLVS